MYVGKHPGYLQAVCPCMPARMMHEKVYLDTRVLKLYPLKPVGLGIIYDTLLCAGQGACILAGVHRGVYRDHFSRVADVVGDDRALFRIAQALLGGEFFLVNFPYSLRTRRLSGDLHELRRN